MPRLPVIFTVCAALTALITGEALSQSKFLKHYSLAAPQGQISSAIPDNSVSHIVINRGAIWIGTGKGLARSSDAGTTWESFGADPHFAQPGIFAIAVAGDTVWSSTGFEESVTGGSVQTGSGYTYSLDNGATWNSRPQTLDTQGDTIVQYGQNTVHFLPVVVPEQNVTFDIALTDGRVWIASWASGLRRSTDKGATWQRTVLPSTYMNSIAPTDSLQGYYIDPRQSNNYLMFSVFAQDNSTIWAGSAGGVNKSTDGGVSWAKFSVTNQVAHILGNWVIAIGAQNLGSQTRIWITDWPTDSSEQYGVSSSDDGGRTWKNFLIGSKAYAFAFRNSIAYVASDDGLYRTADAGKTWDLSGTIIDQKTGDRLTSTGFFAVGVVGDTVYGGTDEGIARTVDDGVHPFGQVWDILRARQPAGSAAATYAYPNPFSPQLEVSRIHYSTGGVQASVTIELFDFGMNRVRTLIKDAQRSGSIEHDEIWDGKDDTRSRVANGVYFYRVTVNSGTGVWGKVMVLQ